jgi:hypothetical protein
MMMDRLDAEEGMGEMQEIQLDEVRALVQEREKFERWLAQLESRRDATAAHVYTRVRGDYSVRLERVVTALQGHAGALEERVHALVSELDRLDAEIGRVQDERDEAELRTAVGEYTEEEWHEHRTRSDAELGRVNAERSLATEQLDTIRELLDGAAVAGSAEAPSPAAPAASAHVEARDAAAPSVAEFAPAAPDELATPSPSIASKAQTTHDPLDELAFLSSVVDSRRPQAEAPGRDVTAGSSPSVDGNASQSIAIDGLDLEEEPSSSVEIPRFLREVPTEQVRTLKCHECGTMNYPTEWYCERCGGELAAL